MQWQLGRRNSGSRMKDPTEGLLGGKNGSKSMQKPFLEGDTLLNTQRTTKRCKVRYKVNSFFPGTLKESELMRYHASAL